MKGPKGLNPVGEILVAFVWICKKKKSLYIRIRILHSRPDLPQPGNSPEKNVMIRI